MAHYAFIDAAGTVTEVIVGRNEGELGMTGEQWEAHYAEVRGLPASQCKRTSYNTIDGTHAKGGTPFRMNYAGVGYVFHAEVNAPEGAFLPPADTD